MTAIWLIWLLVVVFGGFAILETYALRTGRKTFSRLVWNASKAWPPLPFVVGVGVGMLASHFWWTGQACDLVGK